MASPSRGDLIEDPSAIDYLMEAREYMLDAIEAMQEALSYSIPSRQEDIIEEVKLTLSTNIATLSTLIGDVDPKEISTRQIKFPLIDTWESNDEDIAVND